MIGDVEVVIERFCAANSPEFNSLSHTPDDVVLQDRGGDYWVFTPEAAQFDELCALQDEAGIRHP